MAESNRGRRDLETRASEARETYTPPQALPDPTPEPGFTYRWVATHVLGRLEVSHYSKQVRDGWEPVLASNHPELGLEPNEKGHVEVGGLMLCRMPTARAEARTRFYQQRAADQMQSVDNNFMRENDPRMPLFAERKTKVTRGSNFGSGS